MRKYVVCTILVGISAVAFGQGYNISTIAGSVAKANGDSVNGNAAVMLNPMQVAVDSAGNIYIADADAHRVRKIDGATNIMTVIAGQGRGASSSDTAGPAINSPLNDPTGVALDPTGKILYIAERDANKIKKLDLTTGVMTTVVGFAGRAGYAGDGQAALYAKIRNPMSLAVDSAGNIYIADRGNNRIRKVCIAAPAKATDCLQGNIVTVAGAGATNADPIYLAASNGDGGPATQAQLARPEGVAVDSSGNIYIADTNNNKIRKVDAKTGIITTVVGTCVSGAPISSGQGANPISSGNVELPLAPPLGTGGPWPTCGPSTQATAAAPVALPSGSANRQNALVTFIDNTAGTNATLNAPRNLAFDSKYTNLYIADTGTNRIRVLNIGSGMITTFAGSGISAGFAGDGSSAYKATLSAPRGVAVAPSGSVYITDQTQGVISNSSAGGRLRVVDPVYTNINTVNANLFGGDTSAATNAVLNDPRGVSVDAAGNLYIADTLNQRVRKIGSDGTISTIAGRGVAAIAGDGGAATTASLNNPNCSAVDAAGNVYIADRSNNRVRKVDSNGNINTVAGGGSLNTATDNIPATVKDANGAVIGGAVLNGPRCVAVDNVGNLYIADTGNNTVRKVDTSGIITTVAGSWLVNPFAVNGFSGVYVGVVGPVIALVQGPTGPTTVTFSSGGGDGGPATQAYLNGPQGIAVDPTGKFLYIADTGNQAVRKVDLSSGIIITIAGTLTSGGADGAPAGLTLPAGSLGPGELTSLNTPSAVAVDGAGNVFIADSLNYRVMQIDKSGNAYIIAGSAPTCATGQTAFCSPASFSWGDGKSATSVILTMPRGVAVDSNGNVYVTEALGIVRKLTPVK